MTLTPRKTRSVGSQQGLDLLTRIFCNPGDVVLCEAPSYVGALGVFRSYQCEVVHVAMDDQGLNPSALADALRALRRAGRTVKFLYTIPNYHNPAGVTQSLDRRLELLHLAERADLSGQTVRSVSTASRSRRWARERASGHLSRLVLKDICPRLPSGLGAGAHAVRESWAAQRRRPVPPVFSSPSPPTDNHDWRGQIKVFREMYRERRDAMIVG